MCIVLARKQELFRKQRRDKIWKLMDQIQWCIQWCEDPEPYRVVLFWLDVADQTWGWFSPRG